VSRLLIDGCEVVVTMDDTGTEVPGGSILIEDGVVAWVGSGPPPTASDARGAAGVERLDGRMIRVEAPTWWEAWKLFFFET